MCTTRLVFGSPVVIHRVETTGVKGMAAQEASEGKYQTSASTECGNGLASKLRTCGGEPA
jgi:hypothetical protein